MNWGEKNSRKFNRAHNYREREMNRRNILTSSVRWEVTRGTHTTVAGVGNNFIETWGAGNTIVWGGGGVWGVGCRGLWWWGLGSHLVKTTRY